ncbi:hypothetical protein [Cupriavidus sp. SS-3]|uniref:hypothetical protein n=1 Tax=Cupriavidus sp. SS-3 TaxID=3109596 RepID=UPI002DBFBF0F|nr:hypothetical protein [Cupriavidus sp. SS-3]MEC3768761.1 hypothetical protein [Cupriavidus sp. SS-3]
MQLLGGAGYAAKARYRVDRIELSEGSGLIHTRKPIGRLCFSIIQYEFSRVQCKRQDQIRPTLFAFGLTIQESTMSIELLIVSADHVLFQTEAQHAAGLAAATQARAEAAPASAIGADFSAAYQEAFVQAGASAKLSVRRQTEQLMREAEQAGARLAIVTMMSSRMLSALLDRYDQPADRFTVTATADSLGRGDGPADLLRLVLHAVDVPSDRALVIAADAGEACAAAALGMPLMRLHHGMSCRQDDGATFLSDAPAASWPSFDDIEMRFTQGAPGQPSRYTRPGTLTAPA